MRSDRGSSVVDPWHFGTDPDPPIRTTDLRIRIQILIIRQWLTKCQQIFFPKFLFEGNLHGRFKDKKTSKRWHKILEVNFFKNFFCLLMEGSDPNPGGPKHTEPTDPDPQHWEVLSNLSRRTVFEIISIYSRLGSGGCGDSCHLQVCSPLQGDWEVTYLVPSQDDLWNHLYIYSRLGSGGCGDSCHLQVCSPLQGDWEVTYSVPSKDHLWNHLYIFQA